MSLTWSIAKCVRFLVDRFPHDYAVKIARKIRHELSCYELETTPLETPRGSIHVAGVRRSLGMSSEAGQFEPELLRWVERFVRPGDTVWDVGGHVGLYAIYMAKIEGVKVFSFEPSAVSYNLLVRNLDANRVADRVKALNVAMTDATRILALPVMSYEPGFTATTNMGLATGTLTEAVGEQAVIGFAGDDFARLFDAAPTHLKIDVDGAEIDALTGMKATLRGVETLLLEVIDVIADKFDSEIAPILSQAGLQEVPVAEPTSKRNRLFVRPKVSAVRAMPL